MDTFFYLESIQPGSITENEMAIKELDINY